MIKKFLLTLAIFLGIDFLWLGFIAKNFYNKHLSAFERILYWPAIISVYLLISLGIIFFVLPKSNGNSKLALLWGAFYGLIVYGVYDLTNWATLKDWPPIVVFVDLLWGIVLCAALALMGTLLIPMLGS